MNRLKYVLTASLAAPLMGFADESKPSAKPTAPKDKAAQTKPAGADHGLSQTRDGTLPAPIGTGPNATIGFRVRTEGEDVVFELHHHMDLKATDQFYVVIERHQGDVEPGGSELAREAARQIGLARPLNPRGRKLAFPRWHTVKAVKDYNGPLVPLGWALMITEVTPRPDGWQAVVMVRPVARTADGRNFTVYNRYYETYRFKDGKLKLVFEAHDPDPNTPKVRAGIVGAPIIQVPEPAPELDTRKGLWGWVTSY